MKVRSLHVFRLRHPWKTRVYVVAETDTGAMGIGEASLGQLSGAVVGALRDIEPMAIGLDPHDIALLRQRVTRDIYAEGAQILAVALAGVETALWDLVAAEAREPLFNLIGGRVHSRIRLYANGWYRGQRDPEAIARQAKHAVDKGYTALKIDPFGASWRTISRAEIDLSLQILRSVREVIGDDVDLIVEAHSRFDVATACQLAALIEPLRPLWFEEPIPYTDVDGYREIIAKTGVAIAAGESLWRLGQFTELLTRARVSIVQFDPMHVGGVAAALSIAQLALEHNARIAPHSASGMVNELVCAHIATVSPHMFLLERFQDFEPQDPDTLLFRSSLRVDNGYAELDAVPGLGARFEPDQLRSGHFEGGKEDQNLFGPGWEMRRKSS